uniref:Transcription factor HIVEP2 n=1 Tax=Geotrypetes seraphini TaxID=260995 RepID=A0A6P8PW54_GEOSA|nr:transcription factor HIVEP2 [Geotrypetes seraphini]XP_033792363.1 transcription factor HIVEP2 [Geotrypetes seraphini]XP_033792364.1 transcription factor HIVEP2 [Geotrypetes seraphini]
MPIDYCVEGSKEKDVQRVWEDGSNKALRNTALGTLHVSALLSRELALKTCNKMDSGDTAIGQEATSRSEETAKVSSRWRKEPSAVTKMSTFGSQEGQRQPHIDPKSIGNAASAQLVSSGKLLSSGEAEHQIPEKQYAHHRPSSYSYQHSHSFPQHALQQRFVHSTKPHQSLEGYIWQYPGHLQSVVSEDLFSFHMHAHSRGFSRKKISSINPTYSQYSQKSIEQSEDTHRKEQKPKKPGKYICPYCTRACAKPSVLKKHIRSHTGERPYPCVPCGFSFKTKSNLYKHRKSHAHAIKAGLVPFTESAVSKLDLDATCIEAEIHSDGEQSTDTDEETLLLVEGTEKQSPIPPIPLDIVSKNRDRLDPNFQLSSEEALGGAMKVPILIIPKSGTCLPSESSHFIGSDVLQTPSVSKVDESHTVKQKLALRLSEKKGQDSEKTINLLSPHSKGSTDSGYFSRSESAEQQINPPNTNAKSYEEIIFGKYCRLSPRTALTVATAVANQEANLIDRRGKVEALPLANPGLEISVIENHLSQLITNRDGIIDPNRLSMMKSSRLLSNRTNVGSTKYETKLYPLAQESSNTPVLLEAPVDISPLTRSNSMPTSSATNLSIPPALRGSHSFDERMTGSDDVFYPGTGGIPHQRMLRRQAAFELPSLHEGHSDSDPYGRTAKSTIVLSSRSMIADKCLPLMDKKLSTGDKTVPDYDTSGKHYRRWDEFEIQKLNYRDAQGLGVKHGGEHLIDATIPSQVMQSRYGTMFENRKRRKEKSVGDEEDVPMLCSSAVGSSAGGLIPSDYDHKSQIQEATRSGFGVIGHDCPVYGQQERFETCRTHTRSGSPAAVSEESLGVDQEKSIDPVNRKPPGNVISVIQHTNSLSRPNSFERTESIEHVTGQLDKTYSSETCDSEIAESPMSPDWTQQMENTDVVGKPPPSQQQQSYHMQPRLVRQHNIQVPEIRVTEEPDKPEKEQEHPAKEHEKTSEEFQWPQRSETLSQLPAEKLPPKKKRLRLADIEHSSGESSFESTGTSLSRSPSQESNLSHSSSFSMSFEREELIKSITPKQDEFGKQSEFLTVPPGSHSLSIPGHHHQKEMRRSSSEQMPCPQATEMPEIRSKSFDYGNLSHACTPGAPFATLSPTRERKKCFLVRQASFTGSPETSQTDQGLEQNIKQEQETHTSRRSVQVAWRHSSSSSSSSSVLQSSQSEDSGQKIIGSSNSSHHSHLSIHMANQETTRNTLAQASYVPSRHTIEQQHVITHQENVMFPPSHSTLFQLPYPAVTIPQLPAHHPVLWQSYAEPLSRHFQHHLNQLQDAYTKQPLLRPLPAEVLPSYHLEPAQEKLGKKPGDNAHSKEHVYQHYSETPLQLSKTCSGKLLTDCSGASADATSDQHLQTALVSQNVRSLQSLPGTVVPVRKQTHVPSYGSVMYTSISQILVTHAQTSSPAIVICRVSENTSQRTSATNAAMRGIGFNIAQILGQQGRLEQYPLWKVPHTLPLGLESAIPLCLPSSSDTASPLGGGKRMLSPASSLELFIKTKQQKRVKEEKMYGQIVEELSAVELTSSDIKKDLSRSPKPQLVRQSCTTEPKDSVSSLSSPSLSATLSSSSQDIPLSITESIPPGSRAALSEQKISDASEDRMSPDVLEDDGDDAVSDMCLSPQRSSTTPSEIQQEGLLKQHKLPGSMLVQLASSSSGVLVGSAVLLADAADFQQLLQFPSLRTTTTVTWCFLNYTKPNHLRQDTLKSSVYALWCISPCNPNPSGLNTKTSLALLRSKQKNTVEIYAMAALHRPGGGKVISSSVWKQQFAQMKSEPSHIFSSKHEKKIAGNMIKERVKGESLGEKDITSKHPEPIRIKIFEGGLKSNEDYVYVRGRGRGKYICEECGIRCKKPSMLKKHIRTHTDVRPYVCKLCNFAFKTKGNLTKHMKSKAHLKKCLELGVTMTSVDDTETEEAENIEDPHKEEKRSMTGLSTDHQFSDAEESDGEDGDDNEDEDDDDDDFDEHQGDSTPKTRSRSTSPQPPRFSSLSVTAAMSQKASPESSDSLSHTSLIGYLATLPSIQVTPLMTAGDSCGDARMMEYQRLFHSKYTDLEHDKDRLDMPSSMDEDYVLSSEPSSSPHDFSSSSQQSSPGYDSSPCRDNSPKRYLIPRGDLSPRRHLSPRREISPMRHLSPRKEAVLRRELSPRRDVSPRRHLSPIRPMSPGKDISARRDLSPRQERRYMTSIRAASPRRASYHSPSLPLIHYLQSESLSLGHHMSKRKGLSQAPFFSLYGEKDEVPDYQGSNHLPEGHCDHVFSHLPLHSQQQVRAPVPMIPIGGIQMVHSIPASLPALHPQSTVPLQTKGSEEKKSTIADALRDCSTISKHASQAASRDALSGASPSPLFSLRHSMSQDSPQPIEREQEENIQTCTKAIASLKIAAEEAASFGADQLSKALETQSKALESAQLSIRHFSGSEPGLLPAGASATQSDLHGERDTFGTSQAALTHSMFYSQNVEVKPLSFHSRKDPQASTEDGKDPALEKSKRH